ncbi:MAG: zinc dependent phospholipase C family protein [Candidatus Acidiferrales bacterium]
MTRAAASILALLILLSMAQPAAGYAVLTHEAVVDSAWDAAIKPTILKRFPDAAPEQLKEAHAYAYGGCAIQDIGYYPFGSRLFSDLVHYVRSGDFVLALLRDSKDIDEYAFALGALAHYSADNDGHRIAVNRAVPILYPKLGRKYGPVVTYDQDPGAHLKTEFSFDVLQVAKGHYAPDAYHDHIGFQVSEDLLERAFQETYSLELKSMFTNLDLAVGTYRRGVSAVIPEMTKVAWQARKDDIQREYPGTTRNQFLYHLSRAGYERQWSRDYRKPGFGARLLAFLLRIIPKVGPFSALAIRTPTRETERMFMASFNDTLNDYENLLQAQRADGTIELPNDNFDTGTVTEPGQYPLADKTYGQLLDRLAANHFKDASPEIRQAVLDYYGSAESKDMATRKNKKEWVKEMAEVDELKALAQGAPGS